MDPLISPDIPSLWCYLMVLTVGMMVAASSINELLKDIPGRWGFLETWLLFAANTAVPVLLFWFLDYTNALRDTSLFAAVVVAFGYQQIFKGGVQGILMPGQSSRVWQPFEAWVNKTAARIVSRNRLASERYHDSVRALVAAKPALLNKLERLVFFHTKDATKLQTDLQTLAALPAPAPPPPPTALANDRRARKLLEELRAAEPLNFEYYLSRSGIIRFYNRAFWSGKVRSRLLTAGVVGLIAVGIAYSILGFAWSPRWQQHYHHWRFLKANASEQDRFRSMEFLKAQVRRAAQGTNSAADFEAIYGKLLKPLRFRAVPLKQVDELQHFIFHCRADGRADVHVIPKLIDALGTDNLDVRTRVHYLLTEIQRACYTNAAAPVWQPAKDDSLSLVNAKTAEWFHWWSKASSNGTGALTNRTIPSGAN